MHSEAFSRRISHVFFLLACVVCGVDSTTALAQTIPLPYSGSTSSSSNAFSITNSGSGAGMYCQSSGGNGMTALSYGANGVQGVTTMNGYSGVYAVDASSGGGYGIYGSSSNGYGAAGVTTSETTAGVLGVDTYTQNNTGVNEGIGVSGIAARAGVYGTTSGSSDQNFSAGVWGFSPSGAGYSYGVVGSAAGTSPGVYGVGYQGVYGTVNSVTGNYAGVVGNNGNNGGTSTAKAGIFLGDVQITGSISKGGGTFKIDHPLDPANKFLIHSFVESPDMMNIYNGIITLDEDGKAWVQLPSYFQAENVDFRYQLTCIGQFAPVYVAQEIENNQFQIAGGIADQRISWTVTGIRNDAWANAHRIIPEVDKSPSEQGKYLHPTELGMPMEQGLFYQAPAQIPAPPTFPNSGPPNL